MEVEYFLPLILPKLLVHSFNFQVRMASHTNLFQLWVTCYVIGASGHWMRDLISTLNSKTIFMHVQVWYLKILPTDIIIL